MSNFLYATGERFNALEQMVSALTVSNEDSELLRAYLYDRDAGNAFRFGSVVANLAITADLNILTNGDMETDAGGGLPPSGWSEIVSGVGSDVTRGTGAGEMDSSGGGAAGLKLTVGGSGGSAEGYQERSVKAGWRYVLKARAKDAGAGTIKARLRNMRTGKWLNSGGAWSGSQVDFATFDTTSWGDFFSAFEVVVEDYDTCKADLVTLRLSFVNESTSTSKFVDNVAWWPAIDLLGGIGHSIPPEISVEWRVSTDNFSGSNVLAATIAPAQPTFYAAPISGGTRRLERYHRMLLPGTPADTANPPWLGEWVITQGVVASRNPDFGMTQEDLFEQVRTEGPIGKVRVYPLAEKNTRMLGFPIGLRNSADYAQFRQQIIERSAGGRWPMFVIAEDDDARAALYGHVPERFRHTRPHLVIRDFDLVIVEQPFPTFL